MPGFGLTHKPSRSKLRQSTVPDPTVSENHVRSRTQTHPQPPMSPAPSPIDPAGGSGFKLFSWKKRSASSGPTPTSPGTEPRPYYPSEPPRPILKSTVSDQGPGGSIRFAKSAGGVWDSPVSPVSPQTDANGAGGSGIPLFNRVAPPQLQLQMHHASMERQSFSGSPTRAVSVSRTTSPMRSSRPASPSASSFGHRVRTGSAPASVGSSSMAMQAIAREPPRIPVNVDTAVLCSPPPNMPMHVTTPPTTYYPPSQSRAPPPSPYRPTTTQERRRSSLRTLPARLPLASEMAPRPPRISSLYCESPQKPSVQHSSPATQSGNRSSIITLPGVPMLNIIPATPQDGSDEFAGARGLASPANRRKAEALEESIELEERDQDVEEIASESLPRMSFAPAIELDLDFSPFSPNVDLPLEDSDDEDYRPEGRPEGSLPPSPPFESYPSLPSLSSEGSIPPSEQSMSSSSSVSSIMSFPDVEEALGSMLASLSDGNLPSMESSSSVVSANPKPSTTAIDLNPGLGLGLDLPEPASITAPLFTRRGPPPRIDTSRTLTFRESSNVPNSAPLVINHRVAFYGTAKAHPRSPSSGTFHHSLEDVSLNGQKTPQPILDTMSSTGSSGSLSSSSRDSTSTIGLGLGSCRDSMSLASECSDEDLHTASIINLTPVMGRKLADVKGEEIIVEDEGVGYAL